VKLFSAIQEVSETPWIPAKAGIQKFYPNFLRSYLRERERERAKMNADDHKLLLKVFSTIFEDFAFMFAEKGSDFETGISGEFLRACIKFTSSSKKGYLEVIAPVDFCDETAENILGTDIEELPEGAGENALKELVNICCGYFLAEKFGTEEIFDLSIPETSSVDEKDWGNIINKQGHTPFLVDESPILVRFEQ
jgi:hypothetical protein